jgi:hypothetical protein
VKLLPFGKVPVRKVFLISYPLFLAATTSANIHAAAATTNTTNNTAAEAGG